MAAQNYTQKYNNQTEQFQYYLEQPIDLQSIQTVLWIAFCTFQVLAPVYGHIKLLKNRNIDLCIGPHFVMACLVQSGFLIYGILSEQWHFTIPLFLAIELIYLWLYLGLSGQYAQIVYQNVIVINTCWYVRQEKVEDIWKACVCFLYFYMLSPGYQLFRAWKLKEYDILSKWVIYNGLLECLMLVLFAYVSNLQILLPAALIKIVILLGQYYIIYRVNKVKKVFQAFKQKLE